MAGKFRRGRVVYCCHGKRRKMPSMTERSGYVLEILREGQEFTLYRGRQRGNPSPVLAVALAAERPSPQSQRRLEHEYSLAAELDSKWATRPLALTRHEGRTMLVLEDPGGEPLDGVLAREGQPIEVTRFLRLTSRMASALGQVHRNGMIHKDIKPATSGSPASGSRPGCRTSARRPGRRRLQRVRSPTWLRSRPAG